MAAAPYVERWRWVVGYEGIYEVSSHGNLRSWTSRNGPRPLKSFPNYAGYHVVCLSNNGIRKQHRLHCLVLEAFGCPRPPGFQGAHQDDDKENNRIENLAWKTCGQNIRDRHTNGRTARGEGHGSYKHGKFIGYNRRYYPPKHVADL